jgi:hypothetical protein
MYWNTEIKMAKLVCSMVACNLKKSSSRLSPPLLMNLRAPIQERKTTFSSDLLLSEENQFPMSFKPTHIILAVTAYV